MKQISRVVREIFEKDQVAIETAKAEIISLSAYARNIQPQVNKNFRRKINIKTIVVTLSRVIPKVLKEREELLTPPKIKLESVESYKGVGIYMIEKSEENLERANKLVRLQKKNSDAFITISQTLSEIIIFSSSNLIVEVERIFNQEPLLSIEEGFTAFSIKNYPESLEEQSIIPMLSNKLSFYGINIVGVTNTITEMIFIVNDKDRQKTQEVLESYL